MGMSAPDLEDLLDEMARGRIYECSLRDPQFRLDGLQSGEAIYIDPRPAILETLIHELTHRLKPRWSERRVTQESRRVLSKMSDEDIARWWTRYRKIVKKARPVEVEDE
jgi:hypothetical protein